MRPWLSQVAYDRGLPVRFPGYISDAEYVRLLKAADLVVIPSRNEPFGIVLPEAWSAGKPVVACDVGGRHENIESYRDGIKVEVSAAQIAEGICQALEDTDRLSKFGRSGRSKVYRQFRWEGIAENLDCMYGTVCS
jgi:glycosyltransferase involved in cell wall biosynthesis